MTDEEPPPLSLPSTSTCEFRTSSKNAESPNSTSNPTSPPGSPNSFSAILTMNFDKLTLEPELKEGRYEHHDNAIKDNHRKAATEEEESEKMASPVDKSQFYRTPRHRTGRFLPYSVPFKLRRRRKVAISMLTLPANFDILLKIRLKGDVEPLKMCIFDKEKVVSSKPCSVQAVRPPSPEAEEIDELSEYFTHFVRVELKMSSLAESMYV